MFGNEILFSFFFELFIVAPKLLVFLVT
jgi:hypothetical protein